MLDLVQVTEDAAIASAHHVGHGNREVADQAATSAMRKRMNNLDINGRIVIGEGERDEAPMLYIGEEVGTAEESEVSVDFAVDPLEGTNSVAFGRNNALAVLAAAPKGTVLHAPDTYMDKIAVDKRVGGKVDLDNTVKKNLNIIAESLEKEVEDVTVVTLERDRHDDLIKEIREVGARIILIRDGDVSGAISAAMLDSGIDVLMGVGAAPEGVLAAAALKALDGYMQCRFQFHKDEDRERAKKMGVTDLKKKMELDDLISSEECVFVATGVTEGTFLDGVNFTPDHVITESVAMNAKTKTTRFIKAIH